MSKFIDRPRYLCALGGAIATLSNLPRTIPIIHAAAGCGGNIFAALNGGSGYIGSGYCGGQALPSSNVGEKDIVFGGEERLEEEIENTLKIMDGDLYFVTTGCMVEMIGDDAISVARRFKDKGTPIFAADTGGFHGNSFKGYEIVLKTLFAEYVTKKTGKKADTVNLWGIVPIQDVFWKGNLTVFKKLLGELGFHVNTFFGEGETLDNLKNAGEATLNIVASETFGIEAAQVFQEVHGVPFVSIPFPIGPHGTEEFLRQAGVALKVTDRKIENVIKKEKTHYYDYIQRLAEIYNDIDLQRYAVIVGDSNYSPALSQFLAEDMGWLPELVIITDILSDEQKTLVSKRFANYSSKVKPEIVFDTDTSNVKKHINRHWPENHGQRYYDAFSPAFIVGSAFERDAAEKFGAPHLSVTYPISNRVVLDRAYAGYSGALSLTEDIFSLLVGNR